MQHQREKEGRFQKWKKKKNLQILGLSKVTRLLKSRWDRLLGGILTFAQCALRDGEDTFFPPEIFSPLSSILYHLTMWELWLFTEHRLDLPKGSPSFPQHETLASKKEPELWNPGMWLCYFHFNLSIAKFVYSLLLIERGTECTWDTFF